MPRSDRTAKALAQIDPAASRMGEIKKVATALKKDHALALDLWDARTYGARLVALLIMDKAMLDEAAIVGLADDIATHPAPERDRLSEYLMAHQLMKAKPLTTLLESWRTHDHPVLRRLFWYHQARLRWTGQVPPDNTDALLAALEADLAGEDPQVQWAMNLCAGWIGVHDAQHRATCVALGERLGLYKGEKVAKNCTPSYLPDFIAIEVAKRTPA